jgi:GR25 family glycosyltransferase involved in LPS biosynthesis
MNTSIKGVIIPDSMIPEVKIAEVTIPEVKIAEVTIPEVKIAEVATVVDTSIDSLTTITDYIKDNMSILIVVFIITIFIIIYVYTRTEGFFNIFQKQHINFDDIDAYYINLDRAIKRRNEFERQCATQDLVVERISAIDGKKIPNTIVKKVLHHPRSENFLKSVLMNDRKNMGHFGCFLSHITVYQKFMKSDKPYCLIFEDDAEFKTTSFKDDVNRHMGNVPNDWDIVLFGFHTADDLHEGKNKDTLLKDNIFHNLEHWTGLHSYMINKKSCQKLLEKLTSPEWYLDWEISDLTKSGDFKAYGVFEPLVCQPACYTIKFDNKHMLMNHIQNCKWGGGMTTTFSE